MPLFKSNNVPIHPYRVAWELNEFLADNTVYIGDGGDVVTISAQAVRPRRPGQWMDPGALGSLGVGTGFAIAAGLANPNKEVLCYYGDGAFAMTAFDMETANRFKVPYVAVIGNNSAMNQIRYPNSPSMVPSAATSATCSVTCPSNSSRRCWAAVARRCATPPVSPTPSCAPANRCKRPGAARSSTSGSTLRSTRPARWRRPCTSEEG